MKLFSTIQINSHTNHTYVQSVHNANMHFITPLGLYRLQAESLRGNEYSQCFVTGEDLIYHFPMSREAHAPQGLVQWIAEYGIPAQIHTDNAKIETLGEWKRIASFHWITTTTTEPYSPWQNRAEREIKEAKRHANFIMDEANVPRKLWDYPVEYVCDLRNHTARKRLNYRTPIEVATGDTPDISHLLEFNFYEPVYYLNPVSFPESQEIMGRWLGPAKNVGQALTYWILTEKGTIIARSTVSPARYKT
ncbi:MAG: hypothetical protein ACRDL7_16465, partial [Gaiellaceae bacterium]